MLTIKEVYSGKDQSRISFNTHAATGTNLRQAKMNMMMFRIAMPQAKGGMNVFKWAPFSMTPSWT